MGHSLNVHMEPVAKIFELQWFRQNPHSTNCYSLLHLSYHTPDPEVQQSYYVYLSFNLRYTRYGSFVRIINIASIIFLPHLK